MSFENRLRNENAQSPEPPRRPRFSFKGMLASVLATAIALPYAIEFGEKIGKEKYLNEQGKLSKDPSKRLRIFLETAIANPEHDELHLQDLAALDVKKLQYLYGLYGEHVYYGMRRETDKQLHEARIAAMNSDATSDPKFIADLDARITSGITSRDVKIPEEVLEKIVVTSFPKSWLVNEFKRIYQTNEAHDESVATHDLDSGDITFYQGEASQQEYSFMIGAIAHELAHANDWRSDNQMTYSERVDLLTAVSDRMVSPDRWQSDYVDSFVETDLQLQEYRKVCEYWAVICDQYFTQPGKLSPADFALVHEHVKKTDPNFDPFSRQKARKLLVSKTLLGQGAKK